MAGPYNTYYLPELNEEQVNVYDNWAEVVGILSSIGAPATGHIDLYWDGYTIYDIASGADMLFASGRLKFLRWDHLRGLFRKAYEAKYYP